MTGGGGLADDRHCCRENVAAGACQTDLWMEAAVWRAAGGQRAPEGRCRSDLQCGPLPSLGESTKSPLHSSCCCNHTYLSHCDMDDTESSIHVCVIVCLHHTRPAACPCRWRHPVKVPATRMEPSMPGGIGFLKATIPVRTPAAPGWLTHIGCSALHVSVYHTCSDEAQIPLYFLLLFEPYKAG